MLKSRAPKLRGSEKGGEAGYGDLKKVDRLRANHKASVTCYSDCFSVFYNEVSCGGNATKRVTSDEEAYYVTQPLQLITMPREGVW